MGLSFFCVTDHSYDLDDSLANYLHNDPEIPKWHLLQTEVDALNSEMRNFAILRGEEVTCRTSAQKNIHLLLLGNRKFYHGSGDGAEDWFHTRSEYSIREILDSKESHSASFAAHPMEPVSLLQRILLGRGSWQKDDFSHPSLNGIQFANGHLSSGFWAGYRQWIAELIKGRQIFTIAGNDAHGNFNRFRQIGVPFLKIREMEHQLFGKMRTGVFVQVLTENNILLAIKSGKSLISDGPVANIITDSVQGKVTSIGSMYTCSTHHISVEVLSSTEYGSIKLIKIFKGLIGKKEEIFLSKDGCLGYDYNSSFTFEPREKCYLRAEVWTSPVDSSDKQTHFCMTNPVWFSPDILLETFDQQSSDYLKEGDDQSK
jgi:hypothetical protein